MMSDLEVPFHFSCFGIECNDGATKQVGSGTVAAIVIVGAGRVISGKDNAAFGIERHGKTPLCRTRPIFITLVSPGFGSRIARLLRYRAEFPYLFSGAGIEGAGRSRIPVRSGNEEVFVDK